MYLNRNKKIRLQPDFLFDNTHFIYCEIKLKPLITLAFLASMLLSICQRYKMKANHNQPLYRLKKQRVIINMSKIQNES